MAQEFHRIPKPPGSMVGISDCEGNYVATGPLLEKFTVTLQSEFDQLIDAGDSTAFTVLGGSLKSLSGGQYGFSGNFTQAGFSIWKGTQPVKLQFILEFHYSYDAYTEVVIPIRNICRLPLPGEGPAGNLVPPGPSVLEAISGTNMSNTPPKGDIPAPADIALSPQSTADSFVNIQIGNLLFMGCIITSAEPTFSEFVDEDNYPIYGSVVVNAQTMYTAKKQTLDRW